MKLSRIYVVVVGVFFVVAAADGFSKHLSPNFLLIKYICVITLQEAGYLK
jgi:hypothetical protein